MGAWLGSGAYTTPRAVRCRGVALVAEFASQVPELAGAMKKIYASDVNAAPGGLTKPIQHAVLLGDGFFQMGCLQVRSRRAVLRWCIASRAC